jgi:hypothetical protein
MAKTKTWEFVELPEDEKLPDYFRLLVRNCVAAYARTYNDKLALDYNQVIGKMRALVLDDNDYQKQTRSIRAKRIIDEAVELEELAALARGEDALGDDDEDDPDRYDTRPGAKKGKKTAAADKDEINLRFKVAQERRIFLNLNANADEAEEAEALNLFFVPVTREESERLDTVEANAGEGDSGSALAEDGGQAADIERRLKESRADAQGGQLMYVTDPDGTIVEV